MLYLCSFRIFLCFFFKDTATTEIYTYGHTLSLHDALPISGTAATEAAEFFDIYKMNVVNIPTNRPIARIDDEDEFYKNITDKFGAIAKTIDRKSTRLNSSH